MSISQAIQNCDISTGMLELHHFKSRIKTELYLSLLNLNAICFLQYEYNLHSSVSLIVSENQLAMCKCMGQTEIVPGQSRFNKKNTKIKQILFFLI